MSLAEWTGESTIPTKNTKLDATRTADNRHGEPAEDWELSVAGVDTTAGLSTKNLGGGSVLTGGHTAGKKERAENVVHCSILFGSGKEAGVLSGAT